MNNASKACDPKVLFQCDWWVYLTCLNETWASPLHQAKWSHNLIQTHRHTKSHKTRQFFLLLAHFSCTISFVSTKRAKPTTTHLLKTMSSTDAARVLPMHGTHFKSHCQLLQVDGIWFQTMSSLFSREIENLVWDLFPFYVLFRF